MLKQRVENKAAAADVYEAIDGRRYTKGDLEDPARPGYLKPGLVPIDPGVWTACQQFNLLTPTGRSTRYIETTPDPREPRREDAPADLRRRVETAKGALDDVHARIQAALDERMEAEAKWRQAAAREDAGAYDRALAREMEALRRQTDLEPEAALARARLANAEEAVHRWLQVERARRYERAK